MGRGRRSPCTVAMARQRTHATSPGRVARARRGRLRWWWWLLAWIRARAVGLARGACGACCGGCRVSERRISERLGGGKTQRRRSEGVPVTVSFTFCVFGVLFHLPPAYTAPSSGSSARAPGGSRGMAARRGGGGASAVRAQHTAASAAARRVVVYNVHRLRGASAWRPMRRLVAEHMSRWQTSRPCAA